MKRISTSNRAVNKFGAGKDGFQGGSPSTGVKSTYVDETWCNHIQEEIALAVEGAGMTVDETKYNQLLTAIKTIAWGTGQGSSPWLNQTSVQALIEARVGDYVTSTFAANVYSVAMNPVITTSAQRGSFMFKAAAANTGAVSIADGAGTVALTNEVGGALVAGDIPAGAVCSVVWDAASGAYRMAEQVNSQMSATYATQAGLQTQAYNSATTAGTAPTYTASITPTPTLAAGLRVRAKFHAATSAASTLNLNALGAKAIKQYDSTGSLVDASIFVSQLADLEYDGTNWVILDPVPYSSGGAGEVCYFARQTAPTGFLKANGACVLAASYAALASAIYCGDALNATAEFGYKCTDSAGLTRSTTGTYIKLPDLRGMFSRGWDDARGVDVSRSFGSSQDGTWMRTTSQEWTGSDNGTGTYIIGNAYAQPDARISTAGVGGAVPTGATAPAGGTYNNATTDNAIQGTAFVDPANPAVNNWIRMRPSNIALLACVRF